MERSTSDSYSLENLSTVRAQFQQLGREKATLNYFLTVGKYIREKE